MGLSTDYTHLNELCILLLDLERLIYMFYDNLKYICDKKGLKITPIVAECGGAKGSISNWKGGAVPNSEIVAKLSVRLNVSTDFLIFGKEKSSSIELTSDEQKLLNQYIKLSALDKGRILERTEILAEQAEAERQKNKPAPPIKQSKRVIEKTITEYEEPPISMINCYDNPASAGQGEELGDGHYTELSVYQNNLTQKADIAIRVKGDSMEPAFCDGDIVLVKLTPCIELNEIGIFRVNNDKGYIKQKGINSLISINPKCEDIPYSEDYEITTIGRVIGKLNPDWIIA